MTTLSNTRAYFKNTPLLNTKIGVFGQGGGRIGDVFASYTKDSKERSYKVLALNSNDADFSVLQHIDSENRVSLGLGGLGKNPERALRMFSRDPKLSNEIDNFVLRLHESDGEKDDLILLIATLGGGTGTSTLLAAIDANKRLINDKLFNEEKEKMIEEVGMAEMTANPEYYMQEILENTEMRMTKIGVIAVTPPGHEGADVLRQSYNFISKLWKASSNPRYGIAFIHCPDNDYFFKKFNDLGTNIQKAYKSVHDWSNKQIADTLHGILTACGQEGSEVILDKADLKRLFTEGMGALTFSKSEMEVTPETTNADIVDQFKKLMGTNILQEDLPLKEEGANGVEIGRKFSNLGVVSVVDNCAKNVIGDTVAANILNALTKDVNVVGAAINGFTKTPNQFKSTAYVVYKFTSLPPHIQRLIDKHNQVVDAESEVEGIKAQVGVVSKQIDYNQNVGFDFLGDDDGGLLDFGKRKPAPKATKPNEDTQSVEDIERNFAKFFG